MTISLMSAHQTEVSAGEYSIWGLVTPGLAFRGIKRRQILIETYQNLTI